MKNILVATDFSNDAYAALFYATQLLASTSCTFYVLNVFNKLTPLDDGKSKLFQGKKLLERLQVRSEEKLTNSIHKIVMDSENTQHQFRTLSKKGNLVKIMNRAIAEYHIDLVLMGSKGKTGANEIFLGSNTVQMANAISGCPILAVPKQIDFKTPKEIAFVTDLKKGCDKNAIAPLLYLASLSSASIRVMHISEEEILNQEQEAHRRFLEHCLEDIDHSFHWLPEFDDKAKVINSFLEKLQIDLFTMIHYKRSFLEKLVREPIIKDVSIYADIPFLILPLQD